jgi:hypothetical protein
VNCDKNYIYESPDGGHTIFRRKIGNNERELYSEDNFAIKTKARREWIEIFDRTDSHPTLQAAMDRVILVHRLTKNHG